MKQIECKNLTKTYGEHVIFQNLNLTFHQGTITGIIGESGCGKSTLLNLIGLLENSNDGEIIYDGYGSCRPNRHGVVKLLRYEIAYLFQNYALIDNETVLQNLKIALTYANYKNDNQIILNALHKVHLDETFLSKKIYTLSGGEQQRVAMARILLKPCSVILADEPTGNLDNTNKLEIFHLLQDMAKENKIVIVVTHDQELADLCDETIVLTKQ